MCAQPVRKAIFPVAGLGTRFLPATKANPKEMLPIVDKPLIQYAVEEAIEAGITQLIFVTSSSKRAIEDHFDSNHELEVRLQEGQKYHLLEVVRNIRPAGINCVYVRQPEPRGLGNAVLCAREMIGDEPFAVLLADDLIDSGNKGCLKRLCEQYEARPGNYLAVESIDKSQSEKYGMVDIDSALSERLFALKNIIEKPKAELAPSHLAVAGRYVLHASIFDFLKGAKPGRGGEVQLTDAIAELMAIESTYAYEFEGTRYDCGSKIGYLKAMLAYGLKHEEVGQEFKQLLAGFAQGLKLGKANPKVTLETA